MTTDLDRQAAVLYALLALDGEMTAEEYATCRRIVENLEVEYLKPLTPERTDWFIRYFQRVADLGEQRMRVSR